MNNNKNRTVSDKLIFIFIDKVNNFKYEFIK